MDGNRAIDKSSLTQYIFDALGKDLLTADQLAERIGYDVEVLRPVLKSLIGSGKLKVSKGGKLGAVEAYGLIRGRLSVNEAGKGFVRPDGATGRDSDIMIQSKNLEDALHGDIVLIRKSEKAAARTMRQFRGRVRGLDGFRREEYHVVRVVQRANEAMVGTVDGDFLIPSNQRIHRDIVIAENPVRAVEGDQVTAEVLSWGDHKRPIRVRVKEVLGKFGEQGIDILTTALQFGLTREFPAPVLEEAETLNREIDPAGRVDFREEMTVTIDGADAKDIDDAISLRKLTQSKKEVPAEGVAAGVVAGAAGGSLGGAAGVLRKPVKDAVYELKVHIADVSHYVRPGTALDEEALRRATSVYLLDRVIPMLPERLSNDLCSLGEGKERYTLTCVMQLDATGKVVAHELVKGVIRSDARLTYDAVTNFLEGKLGEESKAGIAAGMAKGLLQVETNSAKNAAPTADGESVAVQVPSRDPMLDPKTCEPFGEMLHDMKELAEILRKKRMKRGAVDLDFPEPFIVLGDDGVPTEIRQAVRGVASNIIEEFMLIANETVAEHCFWMQMPFVYRVHEDPSPEKVLNLRRFVRLMGYKVRGSEDSVNIAEIVDMVRGTKHANAIGKVALRSMMQARYSPDNLGHYGLAARYYCHFTAPIRRYPDLFIHRAISEMLAGKEFEAEELEFGLGSDTDTNEHFDSVGTGDSMEPAGLEVEDAALESKDLLALSHEAALQEMGDRYLEEAQQTDEAAPTRRKSGLVQRGGTRNIAWLGWNPTEVAERSSEREQNAETAERAVNAMKMAEYMLRHIGDEFEGTISSVTGFGFFVELDNLTEGLVHISSLPGGRYEFFEEKLSLQNISTGVSFSIGDRVRVEVEDADPASGRVFLVLSRSKKKGAALADVDGSGVNGSQKVGDGTQFETAAASAGRASSERQRINKVGSSLAHERVKTHVGDPRKTKHDKKDKKDKKTRREKKREAKKAAKKEAKKVNKKP